MQKGTAALFVLIAILIVGLIGIFSFKVFKSLTPQVLKPSPKTSDVKPAVYRSEMLGVVFEYSKNFKVSEDSEAEFNQRAAGSASKSVNGDYRKNFKGYVGYEPGKVLGALAVLDKEQNFDINPFSVWVFDNPDNLTAEAWFDKYWYYPFLWGVFDYTSKGHVVPDQEATISGKAARYKIVSYQPNSPKFMYVSNGAKMYLFRIIGNEGERTSSTFKFPQ